MHTLRAQIDHMSQRPFMGRLLAFLNGDLYPLLFAVLVLLSSFLGAELFLFGFTAIVIAFACIFGKSAKSVLVPMVLVVYGMSWRHTPQHPYLSDFLYRTDVLILIGVFSAVAFASMLFHFFLRGADKNGGGGLTFGFLFFGAALLFNGLFSGSYVAQDGVLGALLSLSFVGVYLFVAFFLREKIPVRYFAYLLLLASAIVCIQTIKQAFNIAFFRDSFDAKYGYKDLMVAGWGMSNNVGGMLAMFLPALFYFAYKSRYGWAFYLWAFVQYGCICLTYSRTAMLFGGVLFLGGAVLLFVLKSPCRTFFRIADGVTAAVLIVVFAAFSGKILDLIYAAIERGDMGRFDLWKNGLLNFLSAPFFGSGFYAPIDPSDPNWSYNIVNWVFPDMYHNLFVQVAASCGVFGLFALFLHFSEVSAFAFSGRFTAEKLFCLAVAAMVAATSLLDNHIFHIFPAILYALSLSVLEKQNAGAGFGASKKLRQRHFLCRYGTRFFPF